MSRGALLAVGGWIACALALVGCSAAPAGRGGPEPVEVARPMAVPAPADASSATPAEPPAAAPPPAPLNASASIDDLEVEGDRLTIPVAADGAARLRDGRAVSDEDLARLMRELRARRGDVAAVLAADGTLPYGRLIEIMDVLRQAGVMRFSFAIAPKGP